MFYPVFNPFFRSVAACSGPGGRRSAGAAGRGQKPENTPSVTTLHNIVGFTHPGD